MLQFKLIENRPGYELAKAVREEVFMAEQGYPFDYDQRDETAWHIIGWDGDTAIAAGRLFQIDGYVFGIGRIAVKKEYRGQYIGDTVMRALEDKAVQLGAAFIELYAQVQAVGFYQKQGYASIGEPCIYDGTPHQKMRRDLSKIRGCRGCAYE